MSSKKEIFAKYGIEYKAGKIYHSEYGWINLLLVNGNEKIGKGVYHFSTLPGTMTYTVMVNGKEYIVKGTCACNCVGCYAMSGNYNYPSVRNALGIRTLIARNDAYFMYRAIMAQIEAENINAIRIHASGDFVSYEYRWTWQKIVSNNPHVNFWTYTKIADAEKDFDAFSNANIVKSVIPGIGFNFGHCDYIINTYNVLVNANKSVHVCRCGIDKNQHCVNCKGCSKNEYVLFIEHSTDYVAEKDASFSTLKSIIDNQPEE